MLVCPRWEGCVGECWPHWRGSVSLAAPINRHPFLKRRLRQLSTQAPLWTARATREKAPAGESDAGQLKLHSHPLFPSGASSGYPKEIQVRFAPTDEHDLILAGFLVFLDPPKSDAAASIARSTHLLSTVPPDASADPVLSRYADAIAEAPRLRWVGYLSTTGVYGDRKGDWVDEGTDWYRVSVFGDRAERAAEQLRKGNRVFVEGRFKTREFEGNDGQKRTSLDVTADNVISLDRKGRDDDGAFAGAPAAVGSAAPSRGAGDDTDLDDLPF